MKTVLATTLAAGAGALALCGPTDLDRSVLEHGWTASAKAQKIGWTNVELILAYSPDSSDQDPTRINLSISGQMREVTDFTLPLNGGPKPESLLIETGCGKVKVPVLPRAESELTELEGTDFRVKAFVRKNGDVGVRFRSSLKGGEESCSLTNPTFVGASGEMNNVLSGKTIVFDPDDTVLPLAHDARLIVEGARVIEEGRPATGSTQVSARVDDWNDGHPWKALKFKKTKSPYYHMVVVAEGISTDPAEALTLTGTVMDGKTGLPLLVADTTLPKRRSRTFDGAMYFADPESVGGMEYLAELTLQGEGGEEIGYLSMRVLATDPETDVEQDDPRAAGGVYAEATTDAFGIQAYLSRDAGSETYSLTIVADGESVRDIASIGAFVTPLDGGSDADPGDLQLDFVEQCERFVVKGNAGPGSSETDGISYNMTLTGLNGQRSRLIGDLDDFPGGIQEGRGQGTKRSCSRARSRPELQ